MSKRAELELTSEDHQKAFTEVSFLMEIFILTMKDVVGAGTASVARNAGKQMSKKLPIYLGDKPSMEEVMRPVLEHLSAGFEIDMKTQGNVAELDFGRCAIRDVCKNRGIPPGGELCKVFHGFLAGIANELSGRPVRTVKMEAAAARCACRMESQ